MNYVKFGECIVRSDFSFCLYFVSFKIKQYFCSEYLECACFEDVYGNLHMKTLLDKQFIVVPLQACIKGATIYIGGE